MYKYYRFAREPICGEYEELIRYACDHSDAVMLVYQIRKGNKLRNASKRAMRKEFAKWRIKTRHDPQWPATISEDTNHVYTIDVYRICDEIREYLLSSVFRLYDWGKGYLPMDIAFFCQQECWLATCSHEEAGWLRTEQKLPAFFKPFIGEISHPDETVYTEKYNLDE